mgnify:CR=1 FL=1
MFTTLSCLLQFLLNLLLSNSFKLVDKGQITTVREIFVKLKIRALALRQSEIHHDKGLTLYKSVFKPFRMLIKP